jgi:RNA polymerase-interacting CarD/CdnL/TRCF family regulator
MDVAAVFFVHKINLRASFDGHEPVDELNDAFSFLKHELETVSSNWITTLVELADEYAGKLSDDDVENWIELCEDLANQKRDAQSFQQERLFVWHRLSLRDEVDAATEADQERLIESFEEEAAVKGRESDNLRATVLESALRSCIEFLSEEKKQKWKREALEARRTGINEMVELPLENELEEAAADEARNNVDRIVEWVNQTKEYYPDSTYALYCLLWSDGYIPSYERSRLIEGGFVFSQMMDTRVISPEGHAIGTNPSIREQEERRRVPQNYVRNLSQNHITLTSALYRLFEDRVITEFDFYKLLAISDASADTVAFLTDAILDLVNGKYIRSFSLAIHQLEGAIVDTLDAQEQAISALSEDGTEQRALGGLLKTLEGDIDEEYRIYLLTTYTDGRGLNYRNRWSHGQMGYRDLSFRAASLVIFDTLKTVLHLNPSPFLSIYSLPSRTISTKQRRQKEINIGNFVDPDETVLGYGYEEPVGLIIVDDPENDKTIFRAIRASVFDDYPIPDRDLDRDDLIEQIEMLASSVPTLPSDLGIVWLDTDEAIRKHVEEIVRTLNENPFETATVDQIYEVAANYAISEDAVGDALDKLTAEDRLEDKDDIYSIN